MINDIFSLHENLKMSIIHHQTDKQQSNTELLVRINHKNKYLHQKVNLNISDQQ